MDSHKSSLSKLNWLTSTPFLLLSMGALQVIWLLLTWVSGAAENWIKIPWLLAYSLTATAVCLLPSERFPWNKPAIRASLLKYQHLFLPAALGLALLFGLVYGFYQRLWPDENLVMGVAVPLAEKGLGHLLEIYRSSSYMRQHPPLLFVLFALALRLFNMNLLALRYITLVFALLTLVVTFRLGKELYDRATGIIGALFLFSFPLFMRLGTTGMSDMPVTFFFLLSIYLLTRFVRAPSVWLAIATGASLAIGMMVKYTMVFILPVLFAFFIFIPEFRKFRRAFYAGLALAAILLSAWLVYAWQAGVLANQFKTLASYSTVVFRTEIGKSFLLESLFTRLPSAIGPYNLPLILLGLKSALQARRSADKTLFLWASIVFVLLCLTLPDHRYFMPTFPAVALLMARGLEGLPESRNRLVALSLLFGLGALYLFVDWNRLGLIFLSN
ncbi:MAG: glycosyltransferase family 39 protein [Chloroflexota bacterium]